MTHIPSAMKFVYEVKHLPTLGGVLRIRETYWRCASRNGWDCQHFCGRGNVAGNNIEATDPRQRPVRRDNYILNVILFLAVILIPIELSSHCRSGNRSYKTPTAALFDVWSEFQRISKRPIWHETKHVARVSRKSWELWYPSSIRAQLKLFCLTAFYIWISLFSLSCQRSSRDVCYVTGYGLTSRKFSEVEVTQSNRCQDE